MHWNNYTQSQTCRLEEMQRTLQFKTSCHDFRLLKRGPIYFNRFISSFSICSRNLTLVHNKLIFKNCEISYLWVKVTSEVCWTTSSAHFHPNWRRLTFLTGKTVTFTTNILHSYKIYVLLKGCYTYTSLKYKIKVEFSFITVNSLDAIYAHMLTKTHGRVKESTFKKSSFLKRKKRR